MSRRRSPPGGQDGGEAAQVGDAVEQAEMQEDGVREGLGGAGPGEPAQFAGVDDVDADVREVGGLARAHRREVRAGVEAVEAAGGGGDGLGHEAAAAAEVGHHVGLGDPQPRHDLGRVAAPLLADLLDPLLGRLPEPPADEQPQHLPLGLEAPGLAQASTPRLRAGWTRSLPAGRAPAQEGSGQGGIGGRSRS